MIDLNNMSDEERQILEEVAKAKGRTLEEALIDLGHTLTPEQDAAVSFEGTAETEPEAPHVMEEPIRVEKEPLVTPAVDSLQVEVEPEFEAPPPAEADEEPPAADEEEEPPTAGEEGEYGPGGTIKQICVQCGWDQDNPTIPEPDHKDKISFLHSILGHKVFSKRYTMFGGNLRVTFRTLSIREIDVLYQAAFQAQRDEHILTTADYYEYLNRLRLYLQLTSFSAKTSALQIKLPEGFTKETHEGANSYWDDYLRKEGIYNEGISLIKQVSDYVIDKVMKTEHLQRTITHECSKFNRLVAKLESSVDNPDFWRETEQLS
jgi:hypothetical protein